MKLAKSLLLGSAAGLCAVAGAQAADLPMRKAAPVEYVRVCTAYGAGFFYIPGTDTCLRVGGRARFEYQYTSQRSRNSDQSGYRALGRISLDARTQTAYGTLRTFVRVDIASRTGGYLTSGTGQRYGYSYAALGVDEVGRNQKFVDIDRAFIQFAGFTAGRTVSFYDFYSHDLELVGSSVGSDAVTNLLAYTATFGNGFSASLSAEDPVWRRNPVSNGTMTGVYNALTGTATTTTTPLAITINNATGLPASYTTINVAQNNALPDFIGNVRYDAPWGAAQLSAASHEIRIASGLAGLPGVSGGGVTAIAARVPSAEYGYAVQGGLKFNLPQIAPGDVLWLQAAYAKGAGSYTGIFLPQGQEAVTNTYTNRSNFGGYDAYVDTLGKMHLTESWSGTIAFLHYWTPEIRQGVFASYGRFQVDSTARGIYSPATATGSYNPFPVGVNGSTYANSLYSPVGKDYSNIYVGTNLVWSPVRDLDIGVEVDYERMEFLGGASKGRVVDLNKALTVNGVPKTISYDDNVLVRMRVQRDF